jgi:hypothetical protein
MRCSNLMGCSGLVRAIAGMGRTVWKQLLNWCAIGAVAFFSAGQLEADQIAFDDFENLTLKPFDVANTTVGDGTDWTNVIPGWFIENTEDHVATVADAYNGWTAMDVDSWIQEQGPQGSGIAPLGRRRMRLGQQNNTALVADPDAWDDFAPSGKPNQGYNSYISHSYDLAGADLASLALSFDWDFVTEDWQIGTFEIAFDGGPYELIFAIASNRWQNDPVWGQYARADQLSWSTNPQTDQVEFSQRTFLSGVDFFPPAGAQAMSIRFGCIKSGNDWWFAVDNVLLEDAVGVIEFEDFEGLTLLPFPQGGVGQPPGDGTDYTQDIPNWTIDNDGFWDPELRMYTRCLEGAFDGWSAIDSNSWRNQQGGQLRELFFPDPQIFPQRNTILVADSDAHDDFDVELPPDDPNKSKKEFNSFIYREYDVSNYSNTTIRIEMDWETRIESQQRALIQASFDKGATWVDLLDADSANPEKLAELAAAGFLFIDNNSNGIVNSGDLLNTFSGPQSWQFGNAASALPAFNGSKMILRLGCINSQNNWWFAVDNILIEGNPQSFKHGDANQDGVINFDDIAAFSLALSNKAAYNATYPISADIILDMNADGVFNAEDVPGFERELSEIGSVSNVVGSFVAHVGFPGGATIDAGKSLAVEGSGPKLLNYSNVINTAKGINGLVFDISQLGNAAALSASDFVFQVSPKGAFDQASNPPGGWATAPSPVSVTVTPGSPDRVAINWADNAIEDRWLRVTVAANENTGLILPKTYYLGHLRGETDAAGSPLTVAFVDINAIRGAIGSSVDASSIVDIDKNGTVSFADISAMRSNVGAQLTIITIP